MSDEELLTAFKTLMAPAPELAATVGPSSAPSLSSTAHVQSPAFGQAQRPQALPPANADRAGSNGDAAAESQAQSKNSAATTSLGRSLSDTGAALRSRLPFLPSPGLTGSSGGGVHQTEPTAKALPPAAETPAPPSQSTAKAAQLLSDSAGQRPAGDRQTSLLRASDSPTTSSAAPSAEQPLSAAAPDQPPVSASEGTAEEADRTADLLATLGAAVPSDDPADAAAQRDSTEGDNVLRWSSASLECSSLQASHTARGPKHREDATYVSALQGMTLKRQL